MNNLAQIPGFPKYLARSDGTILSAYWPNRGLLPLKQQVTKRCYAGVHLYQKPDRFFRHVHTLVLMAFVGPPLPNEQCRHLDGDPTNNHIKNLAWGSAKENASDRDRHNHGPSGERNPRAKLTIKQVIAIRQRVMAGEIQRHLAVEYGVSTSTICDIVHHKLWAVMTGGVEGSTKD